ncbi:hypothetical protein [Streptomyces sp. H51]|uniref:hypothetical protein n=1 Tax=Streptomyces sp. H51 TaxID=3111770 RepID=UPI002D797BD3|nr:hypothetical protein [Streptomyces sp. H51]
MPGVTFLDGLEFRGKRVLVAGAGDSGADIACDELRGSGVAPPWPRTRRMCSCRAPARHRARPRRDPAPR